MTDVFGKYVTVVSHLLHENKELKDEITRLKSDKEQSDMKIARLEALNENAMQRLENSVSTKTP